MKEELVVWFKKWQTSHCQVMMPPWGDSGFIFWFEEHWTSVDFTKKMHPKPQHWFLLHQLNCNKTYEISSMQVSKGGASYGMVNHHIGHNVHQRTSVVLLSY
jgi:hypothetical protein